MASTSVDALIEDALSADPERALGATRSLFTDVIEPLADRFEPSDCEVYTELFARIARRVFPELAARDLENRYRRIRRVRQAHVHPQRVFVLSRVTLGADVAVTSIVLDAAKRRFPRAEVCLVSPGKNAELFTGDARVRARVLAYPRGGTLRERLSIWPALRELLDSRGSLILDPDSRLTQLGVLPAGLEDAYHFFESRSYGGDSTDSLSSLTQRWAAETLAVPNARAYINPGLEAERFAATVSFGVGGNPAKRLPDPFEEELLKLLPTPMLIDRGAGGDEALRVERAVERSGVDARFWDGSFAGFAQHIACSGLYAGYDSAGAHVAAACGVPLIGIFAGAACDRMFHRWRPSGPGPALVIRADGLSTAEVLDHIVQANASGSSGEV